MLLVNLALVNHTHGLAFAYGQCAARYELYTRREQDLVLQGAGDVLAELL